MKIDIPTLTTEEHAMRALLWGSQPDSERLRCHHEDAHRGGRYSSLHYQFDTEQQFDWAARVLAYLMKTREVDVFYCDSYYSSWDEVAEAIRYVYNEAWVENGQNRVNDYASQVSAAETKAEKIRTRLRAEFTACGDHLKFEQDHPEVILQTVNGIAGTLFDQMEIVEIHPPTKMPDVPETFDPWDGRRAEWFLANMTQSMVFTMWHIAYVDALVEMKAELLGWTDCGYGPNNEAAIAADKAFQGMMKRLVAHIDAQSNAIAA